MKPLRVLLSIFAVLLLGAALLPSAQADTWNKKTVVTFSQSVEVPGKILPAGTYTFQLLDSPSDRHIVQIFDADGTHLITTILAINNYRLQPTGDTVMMFKERPADSPDAVGATLARGLNCSAAFGLALDCFPEPASRWQTSIAMNSFSPIRLNKTSF